MQSKSGCEEQTQDNITVIYEQTKKGKLVANMTDICHWIIKLTNC